MPFTLPPLTRRQFLAGTVAAWFSGHLRSRRALAAGATDPHSLALLADTHIAADRSVVSRAVNMADHLEAVAKEIAAMPQLPVAGLIVGDLALKNGQSGDYDTLGELLRSLRSAGLPLHLALGNHDHRDRFVGAFAEKGERPAGGRIAVVVPTLRANLFVLDTLDETDGVPGKLGDAQLTWLAQALDARADKPAIVVGHHDPMLVPLPMDKKPSGLLDTAELFQVLGPRRQVKAYGYGHTHVWAVKEHTSGIHLVNLPAVAYVFAADQPSGWVHAGLRPDGARLELRCLDTKHPAHGQVVELKWRA